MKAYTEELLISRKELDLGGLASVREYYESRLSKRLPPLHRPIRFAVTQSDKDSYQCELDILVPEESDSPLPQRENIFTFRKRLSEDTGVFNTILIIPTGIGAE